LAGVNEVSVRLRIIVSLFRTRSWKSISGFRLLSFVFVAKWSIPLYHYIRILIARKDKY